MKKFIKIMGIITVIIGSAIIGSYFFSTNNEVPLTDDIRKNLSGNFIKLKHGNISYEWHGQKHGEVIVMVHGFSTPKYVFNKNLKSLTNAGFRVLIFDHFGRGYSDRPSADYNKDFFDTELLMVLKALKLNKKINLLGYSLGGGIATVFTSRHPEKVKKLILIAPVGFMNKMSGQNRLLLVPALGEWLMAVIGKKSLNNTFKMEYEKGLTTKTMYSLFTKQLKLSGIRNALLSTMRNYPMDDLKSEYILTGNHNIPTLVIWGTDDETVRYDGAEKVKDAIPHSSLITIEGAGHSIVYSHYDRVNEVMMKFLTR